MLKNFFFLKRLSWLTRKNIVQIDGHPGFDYSQFHFHPPNLPSVVFHSFISVFHMLCLKNDFLIEKHNLCVLLFLLMLLQLNWFVTWDKQIFSII